MCSVHCLFVSVWLLIFWHVWLSVLQAFDYCKLLLCVWSGPAGCELIPKITEVVCGNFRVDYLPSAVGKYWVSSSRYNTWHARSFDWIIICDTGIATDSSVCIYCHRWQWRLLRLIPQVKRYKQSYCSYHPVTAADSATVSSTIIYSYTDIRTKLLVNDRCLRKMTSGLKMLLQSVACVMIKESVKWQRQKQSVQAGGSCRRQSTQTTRFEHLLHARNQAH